jgi:hypothetical protein
MNRDGRDHSCLLRGIAAGAVVLCSVLAPAVACAQDAPAPPAPPDTVTWSVRPSPTDDEPSRSMFALIGEPGATVKDALRVHVSGPTELKLQVYASDAFITDKGAFDLLPAAERPVDVGSWVKMDSDEITVAGDAEVDIPFTISIPKNATPGDHIGGIVTSISTVAAGADGSPVRTDRRLGSRLYLSVGGPTAAQLEITDLQTNYEQTWNPFGNGVATVTYTVHNKGNVRLHTRRRVEVSGLGSSATSEYVDLPELLPGASQTFTQKAIGVAPTGPLTVTAKIDQRTKGQGELPTLPLQPVAESRTVWAIPWTLILLILAVLGGGLYWWFRRNRTPASYSFDDQADDGDGPAGPGEDDPAGDLDGAGPGATAPLPPPPPPAPLDDPPLVSADAEAGPVPPA